MISCAFGTGYLFKEDKEIAYVRISVRDEADRKKIPGHTGSESCGFQFEIRRSNGIDRRECRRKKYINEPEEGEVYLQGTKIEIKSPYEALQHGIGMVPQELNLVTELSIAENIYLGCHQKTNGIFDWKKTAQNAQIILKKLKVDIDPKEKVKNITAAFQELVSIARTLVFGSNIIILDEPTASLTIQEKDHLFEVVRMLKSEGKTIVIITHHLDEVKEKVRSLVWQVW